MYGSLKHVVVYRNVTKATKSLVKRNKAIYEISEELNSLKNRGSFSSQKELKIELKQVLNGWSSFFIIQFPDDESKVDFSWSINEPRLVEAKAVDGKFLLYSTDEK